MRATSVKHGAFARRWCMVRLRATSVKHGAFARRWCMVRLRAVGLLRSNWGSRTSVETASTQHAHNTAFPRVAFLDLLNLCLRLHPSLPGSFRGDGEEGKPKPRTVAFAAAPAACSRNNKKSRKSVATGDAQTAFYAVFAEVAASRKAATARVTSGAITICCRLSLSRWRCWWWRVWQATTSLSVQWQQVL